MVVALRSHLSFALDEPFVGGDLLESHWSAGAELLGADAYLCSQTELGTVGEAGRCVPIDAGGVDHLQEGVGGIGILGDDTLAMTATVTGDVADGCIEGVDDDNIHLIVHEFGVVSLDFVFEELYSSLHR